MNGRPILIVGAGFAGAVIAEQLCGKVNRRIIVVDERNHLGGNCHTQRDVATGVMVHVYGPHIFNTSNEKVWDYVQKFGEFRPYINRVKASHSGRIFSLPVNLHTINQFFNKDLSPREAKTLLDTIGDHTIEEPENFEEQALKFVGRELYKAFFYGYTKKQWGCEPRELPASILKRIPVRFNYDDNYYNSKYQGIPKDGYTAIIERMLNHPNIEVRLGVKFDPCDSTENFEHIFYSGPIDAFFNFKYGRLGYRTVYFERGETLGDYQGNAVINYTDESIPYTRVHEHKHFAPWEEHEMTVYFKEYSKETEPDDIPYYPKRLKSDIEKLKLYEEEVATLSKFTFIGRLATYRYMDMHHVISESLDVADEFLERQFLKVEDPVTISNII